MDVVVRTCYCNCCFVGHIVVQFQAVAIVDAVFVVLVIFGDAASMLVAVVVTQTNGNFF